MPQVAMVAATAVASHLLGTAIGAITGANKTPDAAVTPDKMPVIEPPAPLDVKPEMAGPQIGIFGSRRVGGRVVLSYKNGTKTHFVIAIAGAPLSGIVGVYIDNVLVNINGAGNVTSAPWSYTYTTTTYYSLNVRLYDGTQTAADATLLSAVPGYSANAVGKNVAYAAITVDTAAWTTATTGGLSAAANLFSSGLPNFTFWVLGHKCYDPRDGSQVLATPSTWKWSSNPSVIEANYLIHELGARVPTSMIDWSSVSACANIDDATVATASGANEYRYQCCLYWTTDERHEAVRARIEASHDGGMSLIGKLWTCRTGVWATPVAALTSDDYVNEGLTIADCVPIADTCNGVRGTFSFSGANFEARDFPTYQDATALSQDGTPIWLDLDLTSVVSASQAQRLARIAYNRKRFGRTATLTVQPKWLALVQNDTITLTDALAGIAGESFRVISRQLNTADMSVTLQLRSESASTYAWTPGTDEVAIAAYMTVGGSASFLPAPGFTLYDSNSGAGTVVPNINVLFPLGSAFDSWRLYSHDGSVTGFTLSTFLTSMAALSAATGTIGLRVENSVNGRVSQIRYVTVTKTALDNVANAGLVVGAGNWSMPTPQDPFVISAAAGAVQLQLYRAITYTGSPSLPTQSIALVWGSTPDPAAAISAAIAGGSNYAIYSNTDQIVTLTAPPGTVRYYWVVASPTNSLASWSSVGTVGIAPYSKETNGLAVVF